jgi:hypothetical protein
VARGGDAAGAHAAGGLLFAHRGRSGVSLWRWSARRQGAPLARAFAALSALRRPQVNSVQEGWQKEFFGYGILAENNEEKVRQSAPLDRAATAASARLSTVLTLPCAPPQDGNFLKKCDTLACTPRSARCTPLARDSDTARAA